MAIAIEVVLVLFAATIIRSALGFGEALVAVPLLALTIPIEVAAPLAVLVSITVALIVVAQDWRSVHLRSAVWLVLPTFLGIPLGLMLLRMAPAPLVKALLGIAIVAFSAWSAAARRLTGRAPRQLENDRLAVFFGFTAGILGGAYGMNGPPLAIYGALRGWSPANFRATLQGYFLPASLVGMAGYWATGLWTPVVNRFYLTALPAVLLAIYLGRWLNQRMNAEKFAGYVFLGLALVGAVLLVQAL